MIINNLKECCEECKYRSTYADDNKIYSNTCDVVMDVATTIGCEHEQVCKRYLEQEGIG